MALVPRTAQPPHLHARTTAAPLGPITRASCSAVLPSFHGSTPILRCSGPLKRLPTQPSLISLTATACYMRPVNPSVAQTAYSSKASLRAISPLSTAHRHNLPTGRSSKPMQMQSGRTPEGRVMSSVKCGLGHSIRQTRLRRARHSTRWWVQPHLNLLASESRNDFSASTRFSSFIHSMNRKLIVASLAGSLCGFLFGYDIGAMAGAAPDVRASFGLSPSGLGLAVSSALLGTIAGSVSAGRLADRFGRRETIATAGILYTIAVLPAAFAGALAPFAACRFLCGVAIGVISVVVPMYMAEIAPSRLRGRIVGLFQLSVSIGVVTAFLMGYLLSRRTHADLAWRLMIAGGMVPILLALLCLLLSPASPHWLALRGRIADARASLAALGSAHPDSDAARISSSLEDA